MSRRINGEGRPTRAGTPLARKRGCVVSRHVVIAGAGPTGLALALMLRHQGFEVQVFEANPELDERPRAVMLHARGLEILQSLDLCDELLHKGWWQNAIAFDRSDGLRLEMRFSELPTRFPGVLNVRQPDIERILLTAVQEAGGRIERGAKLRHCRQAGSGVLVEVSRGGRCEVVETDWLVGCDGARSTVRAALGSSFEGQTLSYPYLLGEGVPFSAPLSADVSTMLISDHGVVSWLPFADGTVRVAGPGRAMQAHPALEPSNSLAAEPELSAAEFLQEQERLVADPALRIVELRRAAHYRVHSRLASLWGRGRMWIAGDAAHVHPPAGGQALNLGLADAQAIAMRLGSRGSLTMSTYQAERSAVAEATLEQVAVAPLIESIRAARTDADLEHLQARLDLMAVRLSHLATDYAATGADRLGSANPLERCTVRTGRRLFGDGPLMPVQGRPGWWQHPHQADKVIHVTADQHVRAIEHVPVLAGVAA